MSFSLLEKDSDFQWVCHADDPDESRFLTQLSEGPLMVQDFIEDVFLSWELRLIFLGRVYSHSVLRPPTHRGDGSVKNERLHSLLDGAEEPLRCHPAEEVIKKAGEILDLIEGRITYARIDVILGRLDDGASGSTLLAFDEEGHIGPVFNSEELAAVEPCSEPCNSSPDDGGKTKRWHMYLMEVELIEPTLYLDERAAQRFGNLVLKGMCS